MADTERQLIIMCVLRVFMFFVYFMKIRNECQNPFDRGKIARHIIIAVGVRRTKMSFSTVKHLQCSLNVDQSEIASKKNRNQ